MKNLLTLTLLIITAFHPQAQQDINLPGTVVEQNSQFNTGKVNYLSNAQIKSPGANPQLSDAHGKFTLVFPDKPFGNIATIYASKSGYETVNEEELKKAAVLGRRVPLKVVMCQAGQLYENQVAYYKIARDATLASHRERMAILQKEGREKDRLIAEMRVEFNQEIATAEQARELLAQQLEVAEQRAQELADKFVTVNLDDQSESYQRAFRAFLAKDIDGALTILDSVDLEYRLAANTTEKKKEEAIVEEMQKSIANRDEQIAQDVNQCVFKARLFILKYEFAEAEKMFELALRYAPEDEGLLVEFAYFLAEQNRDKKAVQLYEQALNKYRVLAVDNPEQFEPAVAATQINLGSMYYTLNKFQEAEIAYMESLKICQKLASTHQDRFEPDLAYTLIGLGLVFSAKNQYENAEAAYQQALEITKRLAQDNPQHFEPDMATTLNNLGSMYVELNAYTLAEAAFKQALEIRKRLAQDNPERFEPEVAGVQNNLGAMYTELNAYEAAEAAYQQALEIRKRLAQDKPERFEPEVAGTQENLGMVEAGRSA
ncbi:MAG: tetratricopeptide repeat protein [Phaeodactylibacter sp.]|nr:tetratricopeptide repeat protein [Phaeodactylibacter sp.]